MVKTSKEKYIERVPLKEVRELQFKKIRELYRSKWSYEEICKFMNVSKTTVFFAVRGRPKKKKFLPHS